jgi:hypothetical protein
LGNIFRPIQTGAASPEHLPFGDRLPVHPKRGRRLEILNQREADPARDPEAAEGRAQYLLAGLVRALHALQVIKRLKMLIVIRTNREEYYKKVREFAKQQTKN